MVCEHRIERVAGKPLKKRFNKLFPVNTPMVDTLKKSGVREAAEGVNVGSDFYEALDDRVQELIDRAASRARENGRRTVKARDV